MRSRFPALNTRVLTAVLLVAIPVLLVGAAIVLSIGQRRLHDTAAARLAQRRGVHRRHGRRLRLPPHPRCGRAGPCARTSGGPLPTATEARSTARPRMELDKQWQADRPPLAAKSGLLQVPRLPFLADIVGHDPIYREILRHRPARPAGGRVERHLRLLPGRRGLVDRPRSTTAAAGSSSATSAAMRAPACMPSRLPCRSRRRRAKSSPA